MQKEVFFSINKINSIPDNILGVYFLYNKSNEILYIGKSVNIKKNIKNFNNNETLELVRNIKLKKYMKFLLSIKLIIYPLMKMNFLRNEHNLLSLKTRRLILRQILKTYSM